MPAPLEAIFTGRNEVVAKVMFLHVSVILLTGGSPENPPPEPRRTPPGLGRPPQTKENTPGPGRPPSGPRRTPSPPDQADPPGPRRTPPGTKENPPPARKNTAAYGQWAAGTHPTGMHSCFITYFYRARMNKAPSPPSQDPLLLLISKFSVIHTWLRA